MEPFLSMVNLHFKESKSCSWGYYNPDRYTEVFHTILVSPSKFLSQLEWFHHLNCVIHHILLQCRESHEMWSAKWKAVLLIVSFNVNVYSECASLHLCSAKPRHKMALDDQKSITHSYNWNTWLLNTIWQDTLQLLVSVKQLCPHNETIWREELQNG